MSMGFPGSTRSHQAVGLGVFPAGGVRLAGSVPPGDGVAGRGDGVMVMLPPGRAVGVKVPGVGVIGDEPGGVAVRLL